MGKPVFLWEEDAWVAAATQIKKANPNTSVVVWMDTMLVYTGWNWSLTGVRNSTLNTTLNPDIKSPCTTGHFRPAEHLETAGRALLLKNKSGLPALQKWSNCHVYDHSQAAGRQYWTQMCLNMTASGVIDGCGADFSAMGLIFRRNSWSDHTPPQIADDLGLDLAAAKAWGDGHRQMMMETTAALGDGILVAKDHAELGDHANAVLQEGCAAANSTIVMLQGLATRARALGKRLVYQCHTSAPVETGNLPAFLIGAGVDHYLTIGGWRDDATSAHWSPLFDRLLGEPLRNGLYDAATAIWSREFRSGTKVTFNAQTSTGAIAWATDEAHRRTVHVLTDDSDLIVTKPCDPLATKEVAVSAVLQVEDNVGNNELLSKVSLKIDDDVFVRGVNYVPSYARNDVQTFIDFDEKVIDAELGFARNLFNFTSVRVFLPVVVYRHNASRFLDSWETLLTLCAKHGLSMLAVAFDRDFPNCACTVPDSGEKCTTGPGGCITPDELFITSKYYRNSTWCPSPGPGITQLGPAGYVENHLDKYVEDVFGGKYADDERIYAIEIINEPDEANLGPFIDWAAEKLSKVSRRPLALENTYPGGRAATKAQALAAILTDHCYGGDVYKELSASLAAAHKVGKTAFNTEFGRRDTQPYCPAFAAACAAKVGTYAWELMAGRDQFHRLLPNGKVYQGLVWPNGTVLDEDEAACFRNPLPYVPPPAPAPIPPFECASVKAPPGCTTAGGCAFTSACNSSSFVYSPALSRTVPCWHQWLATDGSLGTGEPSTLSYCAQAGGTVSFHAKGKQQVVYKSGHDDGIFTLACGGRVVVTVDAYQPETNWWTTVEVPVTCAGGVVTLNVTGRRHPRSSNAYLQVVGVQVKAPDTLHQSFDVRLSQTQLKHDDSSDVRSTAPSACTPSDLPMRGNQILAPRSFDAASIATWLDKMRRMRTDCQQAIGFNGSMSRVKGLEWTQTAYMGPQAHPYDRMFYDPTLGNGTGGAGYTVDKWLDDLASRFGQITHVLWWATYPNLGIDDRNLYQLTRSLPGGAEGFSVAVDQLHARGVHVLLSYLGWDTGTQGPANKTYRNTEWDPEQMAQLLKETHADGFNGDGGAGCTAAFYEEALRVYKPIAMEGEGGLSQPNDLNFDTYGWAEGYLADDIDAVNDAPFVDRAKWLSNGKAMQVWSDRYGGSPESRDETPGIYSPASLNQSVGVSKITEIQVAWFNAQGYETWENVWGVWNQVTARDGEALRRVGILLRYFGKRGFMQSSDWEPFTTEVRTMDQGVFGSAWPSPSGDETVYTLVNRKPNAIKTELVPHRNKTHRLYDCYGGKELHPDPASGVVSVELEGWGFGCILATRNATLSADRSALSDLDMAELRTGSFQQPDTLSALLRTMAALTAQPLSSFSAEWSYLQQQMVPSPRLPARLLHNASADEVFVPSCPDFHFEASGVEIEGAAGSGVDVQVRCQVRPEVGPTV
jgi:hypothetical protein